MKKLLLSLALLAIGFAQEIPRPVGHVNDFAGIIPRDMVDRLETKLRAYKTETSNEVSVVTVKSLNGMSVEDYTVRLAKAWGVGNKKKDNGVVFLIAPKERKCRIEVGYGLESKLTDIQAKRIIESVVIPKFKQGQMPAGIESGTEAILSTLTGQAAPAVPASTPVEEVPFGAVWVVLLAVIGVVVVIALIAMFMSGTGSSREWSSSSSPRSSDLGPIITGAALGSLLASSSPSGGSRPKPPPRRSEPEDDDDDSSRSSYHSHSSSDSDSSSSFGGFGGGSFGGGGASGSW